MPKIVLRTRLFPWPRILAGSNVADIGFAQDIFLVVSIRHDPAYDQILILGPVWQRNYGWIPEYSGFWLQRAWWDLRNVLDNVR